MTRSLTALAPAWPSALAVLLCAFAGTWATAQTTYSLEFLADFHVPTGAALESAGGEGATAANANAAGATSVAGAATLEPLSREEVLRRKASGEFGGISAIAYDAETRRLYALSDSTNPTLFILRMDAGPGVLRLKAERALRLTDERGEPLPLWTLDPEGLALLPDGSFLIASEGYVLRDPPVQPGIFLFQADGRRGGSLPVPKHFLRPSNGTLAGVQGNLGFESLSVSPSGKQLFVATEGPLAQDVGLCDERKSCVVRILAYDAKSPEKGAVPEFLYRYDAPEAPEDFGAAPRGMGLSEVLALDEHNLLTLERGFALAPDARVHQVIRIFQVRLPELSPATPKMLSKRLVLDVATVTSKFSEGFRSLDNFEGLCLGPRLEDGTRTVLMVSDNNYSERQRTSFILFRLLAN